MNYNLSNFLTLFRIAIIPIILILILSKGELSSWIAFIFFVIAALTDFFDGYFARIRKEQTNFGSNQRSNEEVWKNSSLLLVFFSFDIINSIASMVPIGAIILLNTFIF